MHEPYPHKIIVVQLVVESRIPNPETSKLNQTATLSPCQTYHDEINDPPIATRPCLPCKWYSIMRMEALIWSHFRLESNRRSFESCKLQNRDRGGFVQPAFHVFLFRLVVVYTTTKYLHTMMEVAASGSKFRQSKSSQNS